MVRSVPSHVSSGDIRRAVELVLLSLPSTLPKLDLAGSWTDASGGGGGASTSPLPAVSSSGIQSAADQQIRTNAATTHESLARPNNGVLSATSAPALLPLPLHAVPILTAAERSGGGLLASPPSDRTNLGVLAVPCHPHVPVTREFDLRVPRGFVGGSDRADRPGSDRGDRSFNSKDFLFIQFKSVEVAAWFMEATHHRLAVHSSSSHRGSRSNDGFAAGGEFPAAQDMTSILTLTFTASMQARSNGGVDPVRRDDSGPSGSPIANSSNATAATVSGGTKPIAKTLVAAPSFSPAFSTAEELRSILDDVDRRWQTATASEKAFYQEKLPLYQQMAPTKKDEVATTADATGATRAGEADAALATASLAPPAVLGAEGSAYAEGGDVVSVSAASTATPTAAGVGSSSSSAAATLRSRLALRKKALEEAATVAPPPKTSVAPSGGSSELLAAASAGAAAAAPAAPTLTAPAAAVSSSSSSGGAAASASATALSDLKQRLLMKKQQQQQQQQPAVAGTAPVASAEHHHGSPTSDAPGGLPSRIPTTTAASSLPPPPLSTSGTSNHQLVNNSPVSTSSCSLVLQRQNPLSMRQRLLRSLPIPRICLPAPEPSHHSRNIGDHGNLKTAPAAGGKLSSSAGPGGAPIGLANLFQLSAGKGGKVTAAAAGSSSTSSLSHSATPVVPLPVQFPIITVEISKALMEFVLRRARQRDQDISDNYNDAVTTGTSITGAPIFQDEDQHNSGSGTIAVPSGKVS